MQDKCCEPHNGYLQMSTDKNKISDDDFIYALSKFKCNRYRK